MGTVCSTRTARAQYSSIQRTRSASTDISAGQTVTCPTCNGKGKVEIEPGQSPEQLVALIPYRDERLKPRRTKLYVAITVVVCAVISGLLLFFLLPRSVTVNLSQPHVLNYSVPVNETLVKLRINFTMAITNDNYVGITVSDMTITVSERSVQVGALKLLTNGSDLSLSMRSTKRDVYAMTLTFERGTARSICEGQDWPPYELGILFQEMVSYTFLTSSEKLANVNYFVLYCKINALPTTGVDWEL